MELIRGSTPNATCENKAAQRWTNCSPVTVTLAKPNHEQKRHRFENRDSGESDPERCRPRPKRTKVSQTKNLGRSRFLACPFWKSDPVTHYECFSNKTLKISYVKQHLERRHTPDFYCQRCYIIFSDAEAIDKHVLEASCTRGPLARLEGVSQSQKKQLSSRSKGSVEEQWYAMWNILFPGRRRPSSIYIDSDQSEDFCRIKEFSQREGVIILRHQLQTSGIFSTSGVSDDQLEETIRKGMSSMFQAFCPGTLSTATRGSARSDRNEPGASSQSTYQGVPMDSGENSGTMIQSLHSSSRSAPMHLVPSLMSGREQSLLQQSTSDDRQLMIVASNRPRPARTGSFQHTETRQIIPPQMTVDPAVTVSGVSVSLPLGRSTRNDTTSPLHGSIHEGIPPQRVTEGQQQVDINTAVETSAIGSLDGGADDLLVIPHDFDLGTWHW
ncbi:hypothetical protein BKA56DRAFT_681224 [Ilyonectria sp. MPI-CAGE-AT-0026]|nr:hypothetical protein BKA56DRAFT_681224 [Ilyonectria sp. MPI-CAGE-AT-0026]